MEVAGVKLTDEQVLEAIKEGAREAVKEALGEDWLFRVRIYEAIERGVKAAMLEKSK